jgi:hypothetical protein
MAGFKNNYKVKLLKKLKHIYFILAFIILFYYSSNGGPLSGPSGTPANNSVPVFVNNKQVTNSPVTINPDTGAITIPESGTSTFNKVTITNLIIEVSLTTDDTYTGVIIEDLNAGEAVSQWDVVRVHSDGEWHQADANVAGEFPAWGLAVAAGTDGNPLDVLLQGTVRNDSWSWTVGGRIYLSTTAGGLTQTAPSTSGDAVQIIGVATSATTAYFTFTGYNTTVP